MRFLFATVTCDGARVLLHGRSVVRMTVCLFNSETLPLIGSACPDSRNARGLEAVPLMQLL